MLRVRWRELETGSRTSRLGNEGANPGHRQGGPYALPRLLSALPGLHHEYTRKAA